MCICKKWSDLFYQHLGWHISTDKRNCPYAMTALINGPAALLLIRSAPSRIYWLQSFFTQGNPFAWVPASDTSIAKSPLIPKFPLTHRNFKSPIHCWIQIKHCKTRGREKLDFLWVAHLSKRRKRHKKRGRNSMKLAHMCPPKPHRVMAKPVCHHTTLIFFCHFSIILAEANTP